MCTFWQGDLHQQLEPSLSGAGMVFGWQQQITSEHLKSHPEVLQSTQKYLKVPISTPKYLKVPQSTKKYLKVPQYKL